MRPPAAAAVLIVDDDVVVCEIYRLSLERAGYGVHAAADGVAGLQMVSSANPDFIFLDIRMPKMDGIELLRRLVADPATREIPVVMMSNYDEPALINESLGLGAKEYLIKAGTDPRNLPAVVSRWVKPINSTSTGATSQ